MGAKRNHYLPQCYLEAFVPEGEKVFWVYDKDGDAPRAQTPINTGVEGHLYTLLGDTDTPPDYIEKDIYAPLDGQVKPILDRWKSQSGSIHEEDFEIMGLFMAACHVRVPREIETIKEYQEHQVTHYLRSLSKAPDYVDDLYDRFKRDTCLTGDIDLEALRTSLSEPDRFFKIEGDHKYAMLLSLTQLPLVYEELMSMDWQLVHNLDDPDFINCDAPLVIQAPTGDGRVVFGSGLPMSRVQVSFAISPNTCLYAHRGDVGEFPGSREINRRAIYYAERFVISSRKSENVQAVVKKFANTRDQPKLDKSELYEWFDGSVDYGTQPNEDPSADLE